jgi:hypothetical protein
MGNGEDNVWAVLAGTCRGWIDNYRILPLCLWYFVVVRMANNIKNVPKEAARFATFEDAAIRTGQFSPCW